MVYTQLWKLESELCRRHPVGYLRSPHPPRKHYGLTFPADSELRTVVIGTTLGLFD